MKGRIWGWFKNGQFARRGLDCAVVDPRPSKLRRYVDPAPIFMMDVVFINPQMMETGPNIWKWLNFVPQMAGKLPKKASGSQNPEALPDALHTWLSQSSGHRTDLSQTHCWSPSWRSHRADCDDSSRSGPTFCGHSLLCLCRLLSSAETQGWVQPLKLWRFSQVLERERCKDQRRKVILLGKEYGPLHQLLTK